MLNFPYLLFDLWFGTQKYYGSKGQIYNMIYSEASHPLHPLYPVIISLFFPLSVNNQFISFQLIFPYVHMSRHMYIFPTWTVRLATNPCLLLSHERALGKQSAWNVGPWGDSLLGCTWRFKKGGWSRNWFSHCWEAQKSTIKLPRGLVLPGDFKEKSVPCLSPASGVAGHPWCSPRFFLLHFFIFISA